jgi:CheY-like chemotaxis protein
MVSKMDKIMIIEDNPVHNLLLCHSIEDLEHEPMRFFDIDAAKEMLTQQKPDLIIIDIELHGSLKSSFGFIIDLTNSKDYRKIPVIIISGNVSKEDVKQELPFFNLDNFIEKPFNVETITSKVKELLKKKKGAG